MATRAEILVSLLFEMNRFDDRLGALVRANRRHIATTGGRIAESFEQFASSGSPGRRRYGNFLAPPPPARRHSRAARQRAGHGAGGGA
jgi:hypothetical protein